MSAPAPGGGSARARGLRAGRAVPALLLLLAAVGSPARAADGEGLDPALATFVLGNVQFVLADEFAHLVIGELQVPVLGPEENAADYVAAAALVRAERRDPVRNARNRDYLRAAADAQRRAWERGTELGAPAPYWDTHALTIQRFFQIACLLYGADPETYAGLPGRIGMPAERAAGCAAEFARADRGVAWLIASYGRKPGEAPGAAVEVRYDPPPTLAARSVVAAMRADGLVEGVAGRVGELFRLPRPVTVAVRRCGRAEAAWQPDRAELVVCYELLDGYYRMGLAAARGAD